MTHPLFPFEIEDRDANTSSTNAFQVYTFSHRYYMGPMADPLAPPKITGLKAGLIPEWHIVFSYRFVFFRDVPVCTQFCEPHSLLQRYEPASMRPKRRSRVTRWQEWGSEHAVIDRQGRNCSLQVFSVPPMTQNPLDQYRRYSTAR